MFCITVINIFDDISVKFRLRADQRLDSSLKVKCQKRIFLCHMDIKFPDLLGLGRQEIIVFPDLNQEICMYQVYLIVCLFCLRFQIPAVIL